MTWDTSQGIGVEVGQVLAGKYRIERILGAGGMGIVVAAYHLHLDERVAIKFLLPEMLESSEAVARFSREARAVVKIKNEHVARVLDVGSLDSGAPYIVMEFLDGLDLAAWLRQNGPLPIEQAVEFVLQACEALAEAHALGIVHRDLKPANLFCIRNPTGQLSVKVLDFGISKLTTIPSDLSMTRTSAVMGSPLYMSPEQMESSKDAGVRSDIWSVGTILYELLTGTLPFYGESLAEVCIRIATSPPPSPRERRPDLPLALEAVILKCLQKSQSQRFSSVADLATALVEFAPRRGRESLVHVVGARSAAGAGTVQFVAASDSGTALFLPLGGSQGPDGSVVPWGSTKRATTRSSTSPVGLRVGIAIAVLVVVAGIGFWSGHRSAPERAESDRSGSVATRAAAAPSPTISLAAIAWAPSPVDSTAPVASAPRRPASAEPAASDAKVESATTPPSVGSARSSKGASPSIEGKRVADPAYDDRK